MRLCRHAWVQEVDTEVIINHANVHAHLPQKDFVVNGRHEFIFTTFGGMWIPFYKSKEEEGIPKK